MAYNTPLASKTGFGVVEIGANIDVNLGVIDIPQNIETTSTVTFDVINATTSVNGGELFDNSNRVLTDLVAGNNITITGSAPILTINSSSSPTVSVTVIDETDSPYVPSADDYYIGVVATSAVVINLPAGNDGEIYVIKSEAINLGDITVNPSVGETIENSASYSLLASTDGSITLLFRSTNWNII